jgi:hypothetical protein
MATHSIPRSVCACHLLTWKLHVNTITVNWITFTITLTEGTIFLRATDRIIGICHLKRGSHAENRACGSVVGCDTMPQARGSRVRFPMKSLEFLIDLNLPAAIWHLGSTQPLTEMSTRNLSGGKGRPARKANNFTAICDPIV